MLKPGWQGTIYLKGLLAGRTHATVIANSADNVLVYEGRVDPKGKPNPRFREIPYSKIKKIDFRHEVPLTNEQKQEAEKYKQSH